MCIRMAYASNHFILFSIECIGCAPGIERVTFHRYPLLIAGFAVSPPVRPLSGRAPTPDFPAPARVYQLPSQLRFRTKLPSSLFLSLLWIPQHRLSDRASVVPSMPVSTAEHPRFGAMESSRANAATGTMRRASTARLHAMKAPSGWSNSRLKLRLCATRLGP